jgi:hypothetical protein
VAAMFAFTRAGDCVVKNSQRQAFFINLIYSRSSYEPSSRRREKNGKEKSQENEEGEEGVSYV